MRKFRVVNYFFEDYIEKLNRKGVVCPMPPHWAKMFRIGFRNFPLIKDDMRYQPLILGAWGNSDKSKNDRFKLQLKLSYKKNTFDKVYLYLQKLDLNKDFLRDKFPLCNLQNFYLPSDSYCNMNIFKKKILLKAIKWVHLLLKSSNDFRQEVDLNSYLYKSIKDFLKIKSKPKKFSSNQSLALHKISEIYLNQGWFFNLEVFCSNILELRDELLFRYR